MGHGAMLCVCVRERQEALYFLQLASVQSASFRIRFVETDLVEQWPLC